MTRIGVFLESFVTTVMRLLLLSTLFVFTNLNIVQAHEIRPAIADVSLSEDRITIQMRLTAESLLAGMNLEGLTDTDDAPGAEKYDALRQEPASIVAGKFRNAWARLRNDLTVQAGDQDVLLDLDRVTIATEKNPELPRETVIELSAALAQDGSRVRIGWAAANGPLIVRQAGGGDDAYAGFLENGSLSEPLPRMDSVSESASSVFLRYIGIGIEHVIPKGPDHILLVLGLFFLSTRMGPLLTQVSIFTVAHVITLALAASGTVSVSPVIVEPLIAVSIVYVAVENMFTRRLMPWRPIIIFVIGLLHGLGFASVLGETGLAPGRFVSALVGFNIGVEFGQVAVLLTAYVLVGFWFGRKKWYRKRISIPASAAIAAAGAYLAIERAFF